MTIRFPSCVFVSLLCGVLCASAQAATPVLGELSKENSGLSDKRVEQRMWASPQNSGLLDKSFPIQEWNMHFSSVGTKRAPIQVESGKERKIFKTTTKEFSTKEFDMSSWNQRYLELHQDAGIRTDQKVRKIADRQLYNMMMQDTQKYAEMGAELSLRDLNRFQFRRNRSDGEVPVSAVGGAH